MTQEEKDMNDALNTMNDVVKRFNLTVGALNDYTKKNIKAGTSKTDNTAKKAAAKQNVDLARTVKNLDYSYREMSKSAESFVGSFRNSSNVFVATFSILAEKVIGLGKSWQSMTEMGHNFGGSLFKMQDAAATAGLSVEQMGDAYRKHNTVIAATNGRYFDMAKQLRLSTIAAGNYGMSVEQMNDFVGDSMEVSRKNGTLQSMTTNTAVNNMKNLASETTMLAGASDKARTEISKLANEAMSSTLAIGAMRTTPMAIRGIVEKATKEVTTGFSAMNGEAGGYFSKFYADSKAGNANLTDQGQEMIHAGFGPMVTEMANLAAKPNATLADQVAYQNKFTKFVADNQVNLLNLSKGPNGNKATERLLGMGYANSDPVSPAEQKARAAQLEAVQSLTAFVVTLESNFTMMGAAFTKGFVKPLESIFGPMDKFAASKTMDQLTTMMQHFGSMFGTQIARILTNIGGKGGLEETLTGFIQGMILIGKGLLAVSDAALAVASLLSTIFSPIRSVLKDFGIGMHNIVEGLTLAVGALWIFTKALALKNLFGGLPGAAPKALAAGGEAIEAAEGATGTGALLAMMKKSAANDNAVTKVGRFKGLLSRFGMGGAEAAEGVAEGGAVAAEGGGLLAGLMSPPGLLIGAGAAIGMGGNYLADRYLAKNSLGNKAASIGSDAASGAAMGAGLGFMFGGVGAVPGALIGGALGGAYGLYKNWGDQKDDPAAKNPDDPAADNGPSSMSAGDSVSEKENHDNLARMVDQMTEQTQVLHTMLQTLNQRMGETNRLLQNTNRSLN